jgi:hypothetical protein
MIPSGIEPAIFRLVALLDISKYSIRFLCNVVNRAECPVYIAVSANEFFFYEGVLYLKNAVQFNSTRVSS